MNTVRTIRRGMTVMAMAALCALIAAPSYAAYEDSLKAYWTFDGQGGGELDSGGGSLWNNILGMWHMNSNWSDTSGNGRTGSASGASFSAPSLLGSSSGNFTGDQYVYINSFNEPNAVSQSFWFKTADSHTYVPFYTTSTYHGGRNGIWLGLIGGQAEACIFSSAGTDTYLNSTSTYADNQWHHFVFAWDGTSNSNSAKIYVDGDLQTQGTPASIPFGRYTSPYIGYDPDHSTYHSGFDFTGKLDEFAIFSGALSSSQVQQLYEMGAPADVNGTYDGKLVGAVSAAGKVGNALNFDGSGDYVDMENVLNPGTEDFSVTLWVKRNSQSNYFDLLTKGIFSGNDDRFGIFGYGNGDFFIDNADGTSRQTLSFSGSNVLGEWMQIAFSCDRDGDTVLYVDGHQVNAAANPVTGDITTSDSLRIGDYMNSSSSYESFNGSIDDVALWSRALDANEMAMLYDLGTEKFEWLTLGVNDPAALNLGYTTSELKLLADLYAGGNTGVSETIDGLTWHYLSGDLPGDVGGTTYDYGDTWTYDGKYYLKLGSGLEGSSIPEPATIVGLLLGIIGLAGKSMKRSVSLVSSK